MNTDIVCEVGKLENLLGTEKLDKNSIRMRKMECIYAETIDMISNRILWGS